MKDYGPEDSNQMEHIWGLYVTTTMMKSLSIYFGHHSLAFLNSFVNILNKYNVLILHKQYALFINLFLQYFGGWGPRAEGRGTQKPFKNMKMFK